MNLKSRFFVAKANSIYGLNRLNDTDEKNKNTNYMDTLLIYTLRYEFSNDFDA